jgi:phosphoglycerate dehydrogenase-like enzyme
MMAVLMLNRDVMKMDREFRSGSIRTAEENGGPHPDLFGSTLAVVGLGRIGKRVVQLARAHDMQCIAATRTVPDADTRMALGLESVRPLTELNDVLAEADHVVITIPSAPETVGMISAEQLKAMKTTAFLINVARGNILDESATYEALKSGSIAGAALDVWWQNDISDEDADLSEPGITRWSKEPFWELENVIMSPHWSSFTTGMIGRKFAEMSRQIERQYNGEPLKNSIPELSRVNEV